MELKTNIIATTVEWIKFVSNIIDSLIILQQQNKNNFIDIIEEKKNDTNTNNSNTSSNSESNSPQRSPNNLPTISNQINVLKMNTLKLAQNSQKEIESFLLSGTNYNNEIGQGYKGEKTYLYTDNSKQMYIQLKLKYKCTKIT